MRKLITLYTVATFILEYNLISCESLHPVPSTPPSTKLENENKYEHSSAPLSPTSQQDNQVNGRPEYNNDLSLLSPLKFTPEISKILTPDIFTRPDPVHYLLTEVVNLPPYLAAANAFQVEYSLLDDRFPARYIPYAKVLSKLLHSRGVLKDTTLQIRKIQKSSLSRYADLPSELHSAKFFGLFSFDVFSDASPPFQLMNKLIEVPLDKKFDLEKVIKKVSRIQILHEYYGYAWELLNVIRNNFLLRELNESIGMLREFLANDSPPVS